MDDREQRENLALALGRLALRVRKTVSTHIERILRKLGVDTQVQAVSLAVPEHLVSLPE